MKKQFEEFYLDLQSQNTEEFQSLWSKVKKENMKKNTIFILVSTIFCIFIINVFGISFNSMFLLFISLVLTYLILTMFFSKNTYNFIEIFEKKIINALINNFYDDVNYVPDKPMPKDIYDSAKYPEKYSTYYSDYHFKGKLDNQYDIKMGQVKTVDVYMSGRGSNTTTRFFGLFAQIQLNKSINSSFVIAPNHSFWGKKHPFEINSKDGEEYFYFEKHFYIKSTNKSIVTKFLTPELNDFLIDFCKTKQIKFDISIHNSTMFIRFKTGRILELNPMSELGFIKKRAFNKKTLERYYNILSFTYTLSKYIINIIEQTEF